MEQANKIRVYIAALALVAAVCGAAVGVALVMAWEGGGGRTGFSTVECVPGPELTVRLEELAREAAETRTELDLLRLQMEEVMLGLSVLSGETGAGGAIKSALPPPYVEEVEEFFTTPAAINLLMAEIQKEPGLTMGKPVFVTRNLLTVPYTVSGKTHYLLVEIKSIDLYHLQFDVVWDSIEGETRP